MESIIISIAASSVFAVIIYMLGLAYDCFKLKKNAGTFERKYQKENINLKGEIAAIAKVKYKFKKEMKVTVTTLINEDEALPIAKHYKFSQEDIQVWEGAISMENIEAGKLYWHYIKPEKSKEEYRSGFKRILFFNDSKVLKLFGEGGFGEELFFRSKS